ncbi:riboflavin synthase [Nodosilinea sp. LEGE 07298]|uniref:riboflavin synthase n=1 Tax=Nodosilinea sp. LEGE 07298 TaxID=2777970 RepID=UPI00187FBB36|nr:riboflavin synthase [Nodosilinea sp. LEGE 07298]MBE9113207.1 riboflavin synthase [Nodosilinea sp. LEGE 07298]
MFTGLIQATGTLFHKGDTQVYLRWQTASLPPALTDVDLGDSIAVDGICLTVETILPDGFVAAVSPETLDRTSLGRLADGSLVNIESSLRVGSKIGGHFVTGHIDGQGHLESAVATEDSWRLSFTVGDRRVARYIVPKGSIAVNGISLTVADCSSSGDWFAAAVIPVTYHETTLQHLRPGQPVNLEGDVLGKYVEKFVAGGDAPTGDGLSLEFLAEHGY